MPSLNRLQIIGYVGKDPVTIVRPSGIKVCTYSVAVDRKWRDANGEIKERIEWFLVESYGRLAEISQEFLRKGNLVYVEGRQQTDRWGDEKGDAHSRVKLVAFQMQPLNPSSQEDEADIEEDIAG
jgi:single-strand DNA-binding protein